MAHKIGRHAGTGRFITLEEARRLRDKAVIETIKSTQKSKK